RQMALGHAVVWRAVAVARVLADVVRTDGPGAAKGGIEDGRVARQPELLKGFARRARKRVEDVTLALGVRDVVEECAEARAAERGRAVGCGLHDAFEIKLGCENPSDPIEGRVSLRLTVDRVVGVIEVARLKEHVDGSGQSSRSGG